MRLILSLFVCLCIGTPLSAEPISFVVQSGNIQCTLGTAKDDETEIRCVIHESRGGWSRMKPGNCTRTWGHDYWLRDTGPAIMKCGDPPPPPTVQNNARTLEQGQIGRFGDITCVSSETGFQCTNPEDEGFFLSRTIRKVFWPV